MAGEHSYGELAGEFHGLLSSDPFSLTEQQDFSLKDEFPDNSSSGMEAFARRCSLLAGKIDAAVAANAGGSIDERLDLELAGNILKDKHHELHACIGGVPLLSSAPKDLQRFLNLTPFYLREADDGVHPGEMVEACIKRNRKLGPYLCNALGRMERPNWIFAENETGAGGGFPDYALAWRKFAGKLKGHVRHALDDSLAYAGEEVEKYVGSIREMEKGYGTAIGGESTRKWLEYKGISLPPEAMRDMAIGQIKAVTEELEELKGGMIKKYGLPKDASVYEVAEALKRKRIFRPRVSELIPMSGEMKDLAEEFFYDKLGLARIGNESFDIVPTPAYMMRDVTTTKVLNPGAFGNGLNRSTCYVTRSRGSCSELNRLICPTTLGHEFTHHYQAVRAKNRKPRSLPRAWARPMDTAEGLAIFIGEKHMPEMGFTGNEKYRKEEEYLVKTDWLRLGARACAMLYLMTGDGSYLPADELGIRLTGPDPLKRAAQFHNYVTRWTNHNSVNDIKSFYADPDYGMTYGLMYLYGSEMLGRMAKEAQSGGYTVNEFLEAVFGEGNIPLSLIGKSLEDKGMLKGAYRQAFTF